LFRDLGCELANIDLTDRSEVDGWVDECALLFSARQEYIVKYVELTEEN